MLVRPSLRVLSPRKNLQLRTLLNQGHLISRLEIFITYKCMDLNLKPVWRLVLVTDFQWILPSPYLNTNKPRLRREFSFSLPLGQIFFFLIVYSFYWRCGALGARPYVLNCSLTSYAVQCEALTFSQAWVSTLKALQHCPIEFSVIMEMLHISNTTASSHIRNVCSVTKEWNLKFYMVLINLN